MKLLHSKTARFLAALLALLLCSASSSQLEGRDRKQCHRCRYGKNLTAHFDFKNCKDLPEGSFECNDVVFVPGELDASK